MWLFIFGDKTIASADIYCYTLSFSLIFNCNSGLRMELHQEEILWSYLQKSSSIFKICINNTVQENIIYLMLIEETKQENLNKTPKGVDKCKCKL